MLTLKRATKSHTTGPWSANDYDVFGLVDADSCGAS